MRNKTLPSSRPISPGLRSGADRTMISIETVKRAEMLIQERRRIIGARWEHVAAGRRRSRSSLLVFEDHTPADEQLKQAIEEFRKRKLDAIDDQLYGLGVDPTEQDSDA